MTNYQVIIIGGGHNGLVAAAYLSKAWIENAATRTPQDCRCGSVTEEIHPGLFRCSTLSHSTGPLLPQIVKDLDLKRHGLEFINPKCVHWPSTLKVNRFAYTATRPEQ